MSRRERAVLVLLRAYKLAVSPVLHAIGGPASGCRFYPTCSEYAADAVRGHGLVHGGWMALRRLLRCHPFSQGGFDPVPGIPHSEAACATHATFRSASTSTTTHG